MDHFIKALAEDGKLLPLPEGVDVIFSPDGNGAALDVFIAEQMEDYARANVAHATEPLKAEIETLRAALESLRVHMGNALMAREGIIKALEEVRDGQRDEIHRLQAEAIEWRGLFDMAKARADKAEARAEGLAEALQKLAAHIRPTCSVLWDEAQAALRDHDQEVGNG